MQQCIRVLLKKKLRDEFFNGEIFYSMKEIRVLAERWRVHYNTVRPHSSLGYGPLAPEVWIAKSLVCGEAGIATLIPLPTHRLSELRDSCATLMNLAGSVQPIARMACTTRWCRLRSEAGENQRL